MAPHFIQSRHWTRPSSAADKQTATLEPLASVSLFKLGAGREDSLPRRTMKIKSSKGPYRTGLKTGS